MVTKKFQKKQQLFKYKVIVTQILNIEVCIFHFKPSDSRLTFIDLINILRLTS